MSLYYKDEHVTLYHGDALTETGWLTAATLLTDPPYGRAWKSGGGLTNADGQGRSKVNQGIRNDGSTAVRDAALEAWGDRPGIVFGDLMLPPPARTVQVAIYAKPDDAGIRGARAGLRRDAEAIYLTGPWKSGIGGRTSVFRTTQHVAGPTGAAAVWGHSHAKPLDLMGALVDLCPPGLIADPFAGSGSTLVAARNAGRNAIGVEVEEKYCEIIANRLSQSVLDLGAIA